MVSVFEIFSIGIGPSSSHTVGPMRAARRFLIELKEREFLEDAGRIKVDLFGSLAMTGKGHATDLAIIMGLEGETPDHIDPAAISERLARIAGDRRLRLFNRQPIDFDPDIDLCFVKGKRLPFHSNGMRITAYDREGEALHTQIYYSVGGGFVVDQQEASKGSVRSAKAPPPHLFKTAEELMDHCRRTGLPIWRIVMENEKTWRSEEEIVSGILQIWGVMKESVQRGLQNEGELPGGLGVRRRAGAICRQLQSSSRQDPVHVMEWLSLFALAVNEENAAGGRIVTAPTNGAAGIIPAVLHYVQMFDPLFDDQKTVVFFLTAAALAILYKEGASLSAAEMGCQGEIGVACSMAAGGLAAFWGLSNEQVENAAEIGMEHWLGLTCDPVAGLVQIPCIERNAMGAIKAVNAARLAMRGDGKHVVSLDAVIRAMRETGENMLSMYKETSEGGLALQVSVGIPAC